MLPTLCGEIGAPIFCPGREYGSYEIDEESSDDDGLVYQEFEPLSFSRISPNHTNVNLSKTSPPGTSECQPLESIEEVDIRGSDWKPLDTPTMNMNVTKIKEYLDTTDTTHDSQSHIFMHPKDILRHMLNKVQEFHADRYQDLLKSNAWEGVVASLVALFRPEAWKVLCSGNYTRENLLAIGGEPSKRGIYLHILWHKKQPSRFYLHVGQSIQLRERLADHQDPKYRARHPSLHYHVWDLGVVNADFEVEEQFVFLADTENEADNLVLNLVEMGSCLILQTLTRNALDAYLPIGAISPHAGNHLNVALPLHQSIQGEAVRDRLSLDIYHSSDPTIQAYYASLRKNYYSLKDSPNPVLREIYGHKMQVAQFRRSATSRQKSAQRLLAGKLVKSRRHESNQSFTLSHWMVGISRKAVHLAEGTIIEVECEVLLDRHPFCYAEKSRADDPSARLGIRAKGVDFYGKHFDLWVRSSGEKAVFRMNTLVDMPERRDILIDSLRDSVRRWIPGSRSAGRPPTYTSDCQ